MRQSSTKIPLCLFCAGQLLRGMGTTFRYAYYLTQIPLEKTIFFFCKQMSIEDSFLIREGQLCLPFPINSGTLSRLKL